MVTKRTNVTSICSKMILKIHSQDSSEFPIPLLEWRKLYNWQPKKKGKMGTTLYFTSI